MPYQLTMKQVRTTTVAEVIVGTTRLLPPRDEIPSRFWRFNPHRALAETLCSAGSPSDWGVRLHVEYAADDARSIKNCIMAHARAFGVDHAHKVAGIALMLSQFFEHVSSEQIRQPAAA